MLSYRLQPENEHVDFSKIRNGLKTLENATVNLGSFKQVNKNYGDKQFVLNAINKHDSKTLEKISEFFYESSGIYYRLCRYLAYLYRYDWYVSVQVNEGTSANQKKALRDFTKVLNYLDNSNIKKLCGDIALQIVKTGSYYACMLDKGDKFVMQQLPAAYCRSRYYSGTSAVVEFNLAFFDSVFPLLDQRLKVLKMFPKDIQQAYKLYRQGKLKGTSVADGYGWYMLDPDYSIKFSLNDNDFPPFVGVIPSIIDLDQAQELDRQKTMQKLLKIIVQKLPTDKNGELMFDVEEARDIHNNAVAMLKRAVGIDVLTTFAEVEAINTRDTDSTTSKDDLEKVERTVYNNAGVAQNIFNSEGNLALTNSILNDESSFRDLILQFQSFLTKVASKFNAGPHYRFIVSMLETTQYNYKDLAKLYESQMKIGFSHMLPQIALGHSQSSILATASFENNVLHLSELMVPPLSSNTMSSKDLLGKSNSGTSSNSQGEQTGEVGRPEKEDSEKSDKTIQNRESMS